MAITIGDAVLWLKGDSSKLSRDLKSAEGMAQGWGSRVGGTLNNVFSGAMSFVVGGVILGGLQRIGQGLLGVATDALSASSSFQTLQIQFEGLMAREMAAEYNRAHTKTEVSTVVQHLTEAEIEKLNELQEAHGTLAAKLQLANEKYAKVVEQYGEGSAQATLAEDAVEKLTDALAKNGAELDALKGKEGSMVNVMRQVSTGSMTAGEALKDAGEPAKALLNWVKEIAVTTPFSVEGLSNTLAMSMAMGINSDMAKKLTMSIGNFTAGMGLTEEHLQRIIYNFGQMNAMGKVSGRELRDLSNSMVPVNDIMDMMAKKAGVTRDEMREMASEGGVPVQDFFDAFMELADTDFPGAMDRMSRTWQGVTSNIQDFIGSVLGMELLGPTVQTFTDIAADALGGLMKPEVREGITSTGHQINGMIGFLLPRVKTLGGSFLNLAGEILGAFGIDISKFNLREFIYDVTLAIFDVITKATEFVDFLATVPDKIKTAFTTGPVGDFFTKMQTGGDNLKTFWETVGPTVIELLGGVGIKLGELGEQGGEATLMTLGDAFVAATGWLVEHSEEIKATLAAIPTNIANIGTTIATYKDQVLGFFTGIAIAIAGVALASWPTIVASLVNGLIAYAGAAWAAAAPTMANVVAWGLAVAPLILLAALVAGLTVYFVKVGESILGANAAQATFIEKLQIGFLGTVMQAVNTVNMMGQIINLVFWQTLTNISNFFATFLSQAGTSLAMLLVIVGYNLNQILTNIGTWLTGLGTSLSNAVTAMQTGGKNLVDGIWQGMKDAWEAVAAWLSEKAKELAAVFGVAIEAQSPSKLFERKGAFIPQGIAKGIMGGMGEVVAALTMPIPAMAGATAGLAGMGSNYTKTTSYGPQTVIINDRAAGAQFFEQQRAREMAEDEEWLKK